MLTPTMLSVIMSPFGINLEVVVAVRGVAVSARQAKTTASDIGGWVGNAEGSRLRLSFFSSFSFTSFSSSHGLDLVFGGQ
jgi:hypothetical protein